MATAGPVAASPLLLPLPLRVIQVDPSNLGTADCTATGRCDDGLDYAIKDAHTNPLVPHSEWFCTQLAELLGLAGPPCRVLQMPSGETVFGSRWEGGVLQPKPAPQWHDLVANGQIKLADVAPILSRLYAFDHFVHNVDRHAGNVLVRQQKTGHALLAFDYSRAWAVQGFPLPGPGLGGTNTFNLQRQLTGKFGRYINPQEAGKFLELIKQVPILNITKIIEGHPQDWITTNLKDEIIKWWGAPKFIERIETIAKGVVNGNYL